MPYWLNAMLVATLPALWVYVGVGLPWALALLPRADWRCRPLVLALAFACGPSLLTAWMFVLGTIGGRTASPLLHFDLVFGGTVVLAIVGAVLAWRRRQETLPPIARTPLAADEKLLIALIAAAIIVQWFAVAFWPFTAYDALWVYGYQGRLYTLLGRIPETIGYYPQFLSLQYTWLQLAAGVIDDHAARAVLPLLHVGSILAVYVLGGRLFSRRVGLFAAALWALYPHVGEWSRFGDLEIPLTFLFTLSAAFFLSAWIQNRQRDAALAGLLLGAALWTKPTAGAFVWGVLLLLLIELVRVRFRPALWWPRLRLALITGLCAAPMGGMWYIRNIALGHNPVDFPPAFWQTLAAQSGAEFGWPLLGLLVLLAYLYLGRRGDRPAVVPTAAGLGLIVVALLPSILMPRRLALFEYILLALGTALLASTLLRFARRQLDSAGWKVVGRVVLAQGVALPYFVTWFVSYSYHYRLSFAIVPLLLLPTAVVLAHWLSPARVDAWRGARRLAYAALIVVLAAPGVIIALHDTHAGWDWLWSGRLPDDWSRYESGNPALMNLVAGLQAYIDEHGRPPVVSAPAVERLPFFFPLADIRVDEAPIRLDQLDGVDYFVESWPEGGGAYEAVPITDNQVIGALGRGDVMRRAWGMDDGIFRYHVYELRLDERFNAPRPNNPAEHEVIFGGFARYLGHDLGGAQFWPGRRGLDINLRWQVLTSPQQDYMIFVHLRDRDGRVWATWDGPVARSEDGSRYYSTLLWEPGEYLADQRPLSMADLAAPPGEGYSLHIGFYELTSGARVPVMVDGRPAGEDYRLDEQIEVLAGEPAS